MRAAASFKIVLIDHWWNNGLFFFFMGQKISFHRERKHECLKFVNDMVILGENDDKIPIMLADLNSKCV